MTARPLLGLARAFAVYCILQAHPAFSASPPALRALWQAQGASSQTLLVSDVAGSSLLSLVNTGTTRSLVRVDALTGLVQWQTDVVPGVGWGGFAVSGDDVLIQGVPLDGAGFAGGPAVAIAAVVSLGSGERRWMRQVPAASRLEFGENGGTVLIGDCTLTVLDHAGAEVVTLKGVRAPGDPEPFCVASPRLLGEVRGRSIVLVPEERSAWRLDALSARGAGEAGGTGWTLELGALHGPPEVDWRTGLFWFRTDEGLIFSRYNLWTGQAAWRSPRAVDDCAPTVRPVDGPLAAPAVLVQACGTVSLLDPHDGKLLWEVRGAGETVLEGERFGLPEWVQPGEHARRLEWRDTGGRATGSVEVPPQTFAIPVKDGLLTRAADSVSLLRRDGTVAWSLPLVNPRWAMLGDLLIVAPELGETRYVVQLATGSVLGRFLGGEAVGAVTVPGSNTARLLFVQGAALQAFRLNVK